MAEKKTAAKKEKKVQTPKTEKVIEQEPVVEVQEQATPAPVVFKPEPITKETMVEVASAVHGELIWKAHNGQRVIWNEFGEKVWMTVGDLYEMRNGNRAFFTNNWITIEDERCDEILRMLGVEKFYAYMKTIDSIDNLILNTDANDVKIIAAKLPYNTKETLVQRAAELIQTGELDSAKVIRAIEEATGMNLR